MKSVIFHSCKGGVVLLVVLLAHIVQVSASNAKPVQTPPNLPGATVVTAEEAKALKAKGVLIVDARVAHEYAEEHIIGAVNIPYKEKSARHVDYDASLDRFDITKLPAEKSTPVIFYCNAGRCWRSYKASIAAIKAGYINVYWLRGGIPEWKANGFPVE